MNTNPQEKHFHRNVSTSMRAFMFFPHTRRKKLVNDTVNLGPPPKKIDRLFHSGEEQLVVEVTDEGVTTPDILRTELMVDNSGEDGTPNWMRKRATPRRKKGNMKNAGMVIKSAQESKKKKVEDTTRQQREEAKLMGEGS
ncbi:hypothetical protein RUM43_002430 [Polyplax serrata]|uniref:Uncharacterized protein n=1 Tax=Polyplax serrata TaxID=468196 RepID=A0AAN8P295_POLSC